MMVKLEFKEFDVTVSIIAIAEDGIVDSIDEIKNDLEDKIGYATGEVIISYSGLYDFDVSVNTDNLSSYDDS